MAINRTTTTEAKTQGINVLVYGRAGVGKTTLIRTAPKPIIISIERGLLPLRDVTPSIPVIEI